MTPISDDLKHDALRAMRQRADERHSEGIAWGVKPYAWSDEAQTVGWCRGLLLRWPQDKLRDEMTELLAGFGYAAT